jgi:hypothetical protein
VVAALELSKLLVLDIPKSLCWGESIIIKIYNLLTPVSLLFLPFRFYVTTERLKEMQYYINEIKIASI